MKATLAVLLVLPALACGGSVADGIDAATDAKSDGTSSDAGIDQTPIFECPAKTPGTQLYGLCLKTLLIVDEGGGFAPPPPQGSKCAMGFQSHFLDLTTRAVHDEVCVSSSPNVPYDLVKTDRILTAQQLVAVEDALKAARVAAPGNCGADKSVVKLTVSGGGQKVTYTDAFYSCQGTPPYADGLDGILAAF
jgi:hypothetical protein